MIQIRLEDNVAAALERKASAKGMGIEEFLASLAFEDQDNKPRLSPDELVAMLQELATDGNPNYTGTYSREDIYDDHD
jgi:hypothetical protein